MLNKPLFRTVFLFEAWLIHGVGAVVCLGFPGWFATLFAGGVSGPGLELVRWYGAAQVILAVVMLRALPTRDDRILKPSVEALLVGDLAGLGVWVVWLLSYPVTVTAVVLTVLTVVLGACRVGWLLFDRQERNRDPNWNI